VKSKVIVGATIAIIYMFLCVRRWLGFQVVEIPDSNNDYRAAIYSRSPLLLPFVKTYMVQLPSKGDLSSHVVFRTTGIREFVSVSWTDQANLDVLCRRCSTSTLQMNQVDSIAIHLVTK